jgi:hypothetical protein
LDIEYKEDTINYLTDIYNTLNKWKQELEY